MRTHDRNEGFNPLIDLYQRDALTTRTHAELWNRLLYAPVLDHLKQVPPTPTEGMVVIDPDNPDNLKPKICYFVNGEWYCVGPVEPQYTIKVFADTKLNKTGNGRFRFDIPPQLDGFAFNWMGGGNGTVGAGSTTVQVSNQTKSIDLLTSVITIPGGSTNSFASVATLNTGGLPADPNNMVREGDTIWIDVDSVGSGSRGLFVYLNLYDYEIPEPV